VPALVGRLHGLGMDDGAVDRVLTTFNAGAPAFRDRPR
jgi:hypothetical protein